MLLGVGFRLARPLGTLATALQEMEGLAIRLLPLAELAPTRFHMPHGHPRRRRAAGGRQRGHRQPGAERQAGGQRGRAPVRAHRPRRAGLRAPGPAPPPQRRPGRAGRPRAGEPDLPRVRAGHRGRAGPAPLHARCCAASPPAASPRTSTSSPCSTTAWPASSSSRDGTPTPPPTTSATAPSSRAGCRSSSSTATSSNVDAPFLSVDDRNAMHLAVSHLAQLGHRDIGFAAGPARYMPSRRKREGFAQAMEAAGLSRNGDHSWVEESLYTVEGGAAAARSLHRARGDGHRVRLGPDGARSRPRRAPSSATPCRGTSRSWASTTPR